MYGFGVVVKIIRGNKGDNKNENEMYMNYGYSLLKAREEIINEFKDKIRGV